MADFIKGEAKHVGVRIQAQRAPFDFTIEEATFDLQKGTGVTPEGFAFDPANIVIDGHDVLYFLDSSPIAIATTPYIGVFTCKIQGGTYKFPISVTVAKVRRPT